MCARKCYFCRLVIHFRFHIDMRTLCSSKPFCCPAISYSQQDDEMQRGAYGHGDYKGWQTTSDDYYVHVSRMERMPSTIVEAPKFPNFHSLFNNKKIANITTTATDHEEVVVQKEKPSETTKSSTVQVPSEKKVVQIEKQIKDSSSSNDVTSASTVQVPVAQKKEVQFEEKNKDGKITEKKKNGKKQQGYESNIDVEATDFIQNKHKKFELSKWMSLRGY